MAIALGLFSLYVMWKSGQPPSYDSSALRFDNIGFTPGEGMGSGAWPFWLSLGMFLCCVAIAVNWVRRRTPQSRSEEAFLDSYGIRMMVTVGGGLLGFLILLAPIGFYGGMFVFLVYYIYLLGRNPLWLSLAIATAFPVTSFFFFDVAMRVVLPKGYLLEDLFIPLYAIFL